MPEGEGGVADVCYVGIIDEGELPCGTVVGEEAGEVAGLGGHLLVEEVGVAAGAHCQFGAVDVHLLVEVLLIDAECGHYFSGLGVGLRHERDVVEVHQLALPCAEAVGSGGDIGD